MRIADTSFLIALFNSGDRYHAQARKEAAEPDPIAIPTEVMAETLGVLQRRKGIDFARLAKDAIDQKSHFRVTFTQEAHYAEASRLFSDADERINFVDSIVVAWSLLERSPILSFDEDLGRAWKRARH